MSEVFIEKVKYFEGELREKDRALSEAKEKISEYSRMLEMAKIKLQHRDREIEILSRDFETMSESSKALSLQLQHLVHVNHSLSQELEISKNQVRTSEIPSQFAKSDLNLIRMQYSDLETNYLRTQKKMLELEEEYKNKFLKFCQQKDEEIQTKRNKWVDPKPFEFEAKKETEAEKNFLKEAYKRALMDYHLLYNKTQPSTGHSQDILNSMLADVEKLFGWKMQYIDDKILVSSFGHNICIRKQRYSDSDYYNLEISMESMPLITNSLNSAYLFKYQNYPAFFASVLTNEFSKLGLNKEH